ncbi:hypothetical protein [Chitinophaga sp. Cy-1792]|uniref:hypothetical protein n=1 Tax=Chitinophaga sp. Cy-1792 TaxID=2608339 RepID=UPI00141F889D|nr:hypothetical protein [Chitinophaga sp. Cy-1792]NIG53822.1 hypothetical protein [Chitinophaga sp. Cy-1792]
MEQKNTIPKNPVRQPAEDFWFLRQKGMDYIQALGSKFWTDYNLHDAGITTLELFSFAITDIAYRIGFPVEDIFAAYLTPANLNQQAFFPAHEILTINPLTINDFRKLLIDQPGIRNAWLLPKVCSCDDTGADDPCSTTCNCEVDFYGDEIKGNLTYLSTSKGYTKPNKKTDLKGIYDVLISFDDDPVYGDINDGRISQVLIYGQQRATLEVRLPDYTLLQQHGAWLQALTDPAKTIAKVEIIPVTGALLRDAAGNAIDDTTIAKAIRRSIFFDLKITLSDSTEITFEKNIGNIYLFQGATATIKTSDITTAITTASGLITTYKHNLIQIHTLIEASRHKLQSHRNLDEDFCHIGLVPFEDVSFCADVSLTQDADIEKVQAIITVLVEQYLNPVIPVYSLAEMLDKKLPIEEIFNGPRLDNGFILTEDLKKADLKTAVHASDLIGQIMEIPGVESVSNFLMTSYNEQGDPIYSSRPWVLPVTAGHQPRLYAERSKWLFFKNGLPFLPADPAELNSLLQEERSKYAHIKTTGLKNELDLPAGTTRNFMDYYPVQYSYPLNYGIGEDGLPDTATTVRKAQAAQFKTYLLFMEQLLLNYLAQLQNAGQFFLVDASQTRSYFPAFVDSNIIRDAEEFYVLPYPRDPSGIPPVKQALSDFLEPVNGGLTRRNQAIDHLLARFAESFNDYALMLYSVENGDSQALLKAKTDFLINYPATSSNRARGIDYSIADPCSGQISGLQQRLFTLLNLIAAEGDSLLLIEHLLLRPRIPGQLFLPICTDGDCHTCYDDDPYSFRITVALQGSKPEYMNFDYRRYAETTIKLEVPAHLLPKVCWIGQTSPVNQLQDAWCKWLAENSQLQEKDISLGTAVKAILADQQQACKCTHALLEQYGQVIHDWVAAWVATNPNAILIYPQTPPVPSVAVPDLNKADLDTLINTQKAICNGKDYTTAVNKLFTDFYDDDKIKLLQTHAVVVNMVSHLKSIYPPATLHDCEEGNDTNPVRLGSTALGL